MMRTLLALFLMLCAQTAWCAPSAPLTLEQITQRMLQVSPLVREAQQNLQASAASVEEAKSNLVPSGSFSMTASGSSADVYIPPPARETYPTIHNALTVSIPVGGELKSLEEAEQSRYVEAQATLAEARLQAAAQAQETYFILLKNKALIEIARENLSRAQAELKAAQDRYNAGDAPELDVLKARVPVAMAQADLESAQSALLDSQQSLSTLLDLPESGLGSVAEINAVPPLDFTLQSAQAEAQANSPAVLAAEAEMLAEHNSVEAAMKEHNPTLAFQAFDERSGDLTTFSRLDTVAVTVSIPLWDGGYLHHKVEELHAREQQAQAALQLAQQNARLQAESAYLRAQSALARIPLMAAAATVARIALEKTREGYAAGLNPIIDVLNAQQDYNKAQIAYAEAVYDAASLRAALFRALGKDLPIP